LAAGWFTANLCEWFPSRNKQETRRSTLPQLKRREARFAGRSVPDKLDTA
jgi:hypothetical protein